MRFIRIYMYMHLTASYPFLRSLNQNFLSRPEKRPSKRLRQHGGGRADPAHGDHHRRRSAAGTESARWLGSPSKRCGIFSPARPPASSPLCVWARGAGRQARFPLATPPQPFSLTLPRIYPLRCYGISRVGRCRQQGEARHSSACATDTIQEASRVSEELADESFRHWHR